MRGSTWRILAHGLGIVLTFAVSVEAVARVEDFIRDGVPIFSAPDRDADLVLQDELGIRGRPGGRYKQWRLNAFGFRGPEISELPRAGCTRVMTLGASETFGLFESEGQEYPAQLEARLRGAGCFEVTNASLYGLTLPAVRQYWNAWASRFQPAIITIYPTPAFYLANAAPSPPATKAVTPKRLPWWSPRLVERARDMLDFPDFIQRRRVARALAAAEAGRDNSWFFATVPTDRLDRFKLDLEQLTRDARARGARVILLTHATGFKRPMSDEDAPLLAAWRQAVPRATAEVLLAFEDLSRTATIEVAAKCGADVVDLAATLNGDRSAYGGDLIHFNDDGSRRVAELIANAILSRPVFTDTRNCGASEQ
jgi:hypothetical protein